MDRLGSKLLEKLKLTDSGSVKFASSKKKGEAVNVNNNNSCGGGALRRNTTPGASTVPGTALPPPAASEVSGHVGRGGPAALSPQISPTPGSSEGGPSGEPHPAAEPLRLRASRYLLEAGDGRAGDPGFSEAPLRNSFPGAGQAEAELQGVSGQLALNHRRYSLELQQLVQRRHLLSQPPPPAPLLYTPPAGGPLRCSAEPGFLHESERHKRLSLQEALFYKRHSTGGEPWAGPVGVAGAQRPPEAGLALSPRSSLSLQESLLASPRSSFASTASGSSPMGSRCSSNRTSGISLGFDSRHASLQGAPPPPGAPGPAHAARPGPPSLEIWREYLEGAAGGAGQDSRHSYPPALGSPAAACFLGQEWAEPRPSQGRPGDRARYSDLPGTRYQEELTRLLLQEAALRGGGLGDPAGLLGALEGLTLKEAPTPTGSQPKLQTEQGAGRDTPETRQEYFGTCVKCGKGVYGAESACQALDSLYHTRCFTCVSCGRTLRNKDFFNVSGAVYCKEDYMFSGFQAAAEKCSVCGHLILEKILQALGNSYHPGCFRCVVCAKALDGVPFTVDYLNNVYCVSDYNRTFAPKCAACLQPILPAEGSEEILRVVSMNKDYHFECYHCEECGKQLSDQPGSQCFPLDSHLLCHSCHMTRVCATLNLPPHNTH
ncbi:LIM domain-containing protein ajuba [Megalops cyprinoides]|uniref:LIM domain-containing protein ajuba n=1 Tax=Megalops cyprinoides TaxID=118141 RepID=UPI001863D594|nr:LIM domain-containing protein ajuba [Megalops cyprinoides]